jgi:hypothetical protein
LLGGQSRRIAVRPVRGEALDDRLREQSETGSGEPQVEEVATLRPLIERSELRGDEFLGLERAPANDRTGVDGLV